MNVERIVGGGSNRLCCSSAIYRALTQGGMSGEGVNSRFGIQDFFLSSKRSQIVTKAWSVTENLSPS